MTKKSSRKLNGESANLNGINDVLHKALTSLHDDFFWYIFLLLHTTVPFLFKTNKIENKQIKSQTYCFDRILNTNLLFIFL